MSNQIANVQSGSMVLNVESMNAAVNFAGMMASGVSTVPDHLKKNSSDCLAVTMQAMQWGMNPYVVAQKTHLVGGTLGYEAQLVNAVISSSTAIDGRFHYEYGGDWDSLAGLVEEGDVQKKGKNGPYTVKQPIAKWGKDLEKKLWVRVGAKIRDEDEIQWGDKVFLSSVLVRNSPLWVTKPSQQIAYLALKYWSRLYTPAVIMGVYTPDELYTSEPSEPRDITPKKQSAMRMPDAIEQAKEPEPEPMETVNTETGEVISETVEQELSETDLEWIMVIKEKPEMASQLDEHPEYKQFIMSKIKQ